MNPSLRCWYKEQIRTTSDLPLTYCPTRRTFTLLPLTLFNAQILGTWDGWREWSVILPNLF